jgi:hypothetical protein
MKVTQAPETSVDLPHGPSICETDTPVRTCPYLGLRAHRRRRVVHPLQPVATCSYLTSQAHY